MTVSLQGSLMVDIAGTWLTAEDRHLLRQPEVAGLIIFARNIDSSRQVRELCASIRAIRPDVIVKGSDYRPDQVVGGEDAKAWGGRVHIVNLLDGVSTTRLSQGQQVRRG